MRVLFWYFDKFNWKPSMKTLETAPKADKGNYSEVVAAFVHVEPSDLSEEKKGKVETKLVKNCKWLAGKWGTKKVIIHSFAHLSEEKGAPEEARQLLSRAANRIKSAGYEVNETPYGYFLDIELQAPGKPLARIYKEF